MNTIEKSIKILKILALCAVITISTFSFSISSKAENDPLSLWTDGAVSKATLVAYMNDITNEASPHFIPIQDRVAVFDLDGTLFCETDPVYFDHMLLQHRVLEDPTYKNRASDFEKEVAGKVIEFAQTGKYPAGMDNAHGKAVASAFSGMTVEEFTSYIIKYRNKRFHTF